jgi:hypothetical protein
MIHRVVFLKQNDYLRRKSIITRLQLGLYPFGPPSNTFLSTQSIVCNSNDSTSPSIGWGMKSFDSSRSKHIKMSLLKFP